MYFTREQLATGLRFPILSLVKQFLHFSYPFKCHSDLDRVQRAEPPLPDGHFVGRGMLYLYLEAGSQRLAIHVGSEPSTAICYGTPRLA